MTIDAHAHRLENLQQAFEEGLHAIAAARTPAEAEAARHRTRARLEALGFRQAPPPGARASGP